jgi:hypothetical protein
MHHSDDFVAQEELEIKIPEIRIPLLNYFNRNEGNRDDHFIGRKDELKKLVELLGRKNGSYLISGYRGVGKTKFVDKAFKIFEKNNPKIIDVRINLGSDNKLDSRDVLLNIVSTFKAAIENELNITKKYKRLIQVWSRYKLLLLLLSFSFFVITQPYIFKAISSIWQTDLVHETKWIKTNQTKMTGVTGVIEITEATVSKSNYWIFLAFPIVITVSLFLLINIFFCLTFYSRRNNKSLFHLLEILDDLHKEINFQIEDGISIGNSTYGSIGRKTHARPLANGQIEARLREILQCAQKRKVKVIVTFDELDKLSGKRAETNGDEASLIKESKQRKLQIDNVLGDLKNLITSSEAIYIFIAGRDMYDAYLSERGSTNSLYESLFSDHIYIPSLMTDHSDRQTYLLDSMIETFVISNVIKQDYSTEDFDLNKSLNDLKLGNFVESELRTIKTEICNWLKTFDYQSDKFYLYRTQIELAKNIREIIRIWKDAENEISTTGNQAVLNNILQDDPWLREVSNINACAIFSNKEIKISGIIPDILKKLDQDIYRKFYSLKILIHFLALHSWGNYKRLITLFESFVQYGSGNDKEKKHPYQLVFSIVDLQRLVLASHLYIMFHHNLSRMLMNADDKLVVSSFSVFLHIMKYHGVGFSKADILRMYETINVHSSPELIRIVDVILNKVLVNHIRTIKGGIHQYRFSYLHEKEVHFITNINDDESAAFNFSLNAMDTVKQHYRNLISDSQYDGDNGYGHTALASIHVIVGNFYFWEQSYDEANIHYGTALDILERGYEKGSAADKNTLTLQLVEVYLKQGAVAERLGSYSRAESLYGNACRKADKYRKLMMDKGRHHEEWGVLIQPQWAKKFLRLKFDVCDYPEKELEEETIPAYKEAILQFFIGDYCKSFEGFKKIYSKLPSDQSESYFLLGNSYLKAGFSLFLNYSNKLHAEFINHTDHPSDSNNKAHLKELYDTAVIRISEALDQVYDIQQYFRRHKNGIISHEQFENSLQKDEWKNNEITLAFGHLYLSISYFIKGRLNLDAAIASLSTVMMWEMLIEILPWQRIRKEGKEFEERLDCLEQRIRNIRQPEVNTIFAVEEQAFKSIAYNTNTAFSHSMKVDIHKSLGGSVPDSLFGRSSTFRNLIFDEDYLDHFLFQQYSVYGQVAVASTYWEEIAYARIMKPETKENEAEKTKNLRDSNNILPYGIRYYATMLWLKGRLKLKEILDASGADYVICSDKKLNDQKKCIQKLIADAVKALIYFFRSSQYVIKTHGESSGIGIPPLHFVYYNMWEVLTKLMFLYKNDTVEYTRLVFHLRDLLATEMQDNLNIKDVSTRILDLTHVEKIALEQLKIAERIGNQGSKERIDILQNRYYLDDDYEDNMFNLDWVYCRFCAPGAVIYREIIKNDMNQLNSTTLGK